MMLANRFSKQDVRGCWLSEKLDGCRAFWDGEVLRTRSWLPIDAPTWMTKDLPRGVALDGELWAGRGNFEVVRVLVQTQRAAHPDWRRVRYVVFDAPTTDAVVVEERIGRAVELARGENVEPMAHTRARSADEVVRKMEAVVRKGGEGLVLRRPGSCYFFGRSSDWLKVKPATVD